MNNTSWTIEQTKKLFSLCDKAKNNGTSLSDAFSEMAKATGRSVNSVRNYYYGQAKTFELVPEIAEKLGIKSTKIKRDAFVPFEDGEIRELIEKVIVGKANGKSVRATIFEMAKGAAKKALRLQNKYRSVLRSHREDVEKVMADLTSRGVAFVDPYSKAGRTDNFARLTEYIAALDESKVGSFLSLIEKLR
ncbi:MAG: hypothetical protein K2M48_03205 [Clostridiales bacterium]|nr:hypothetical protein [Clostridiales bacterium]